MKIGRMMGGGQSRTRRQAWGGRSAAEQGSTRDNMPLGVRRLPALAAILALVAGGLALDRFYGAEAQNGAESLTATMPAAAPASARSSAWFCAGATAEPGSVADGTVVIVNAGARELTATVTVFPTSGEVRQANLAVAPSRRATLRLSDLVVSAYASALVELSGGQAGVELEVNGPAGHSVTPCASSASSSWYFAEGVTTRDANQQLLLFNPFPDDAVVDISFTSESERSQPLGLTGIAVAGRSMSAVNVGDFVQRREGVTARVVTRRGRIVVNRLQSFDGSGTHKGVSVALGAAGTSPLWYFATGLVADGVSERFQVYNPATVEAEVTFDFVLDQGTAEPLTVTVPPQSRLSVIGADESRLPKGLFHAVTVRSANGVPVVVERSVDRAPPSSGTGFASAPGALVTSTRWLLVVGGAEDGLDEHLAFFNPGPTAAKVSVESLVDGTRSPVVGLTDLEVPAGGRKEMRVNDSVKAPALSLVVSSSVAVVVERTLNRLGTPGTSTVAGIPLP